MHTLPRQQGRSIYPSERRDHVHDDDDDDEEEHSWGGVGPLSFSRPSPITSVRTNRTPTTTTRPRPLPPSPHAQNTPGASQYSRLYSQFVSRYRSARLEEVYDDPRNDPDSHFFERGLGQLNDAGDTSEEEDLGAPPPIAEMDPNAVALPDAEPVQPVTQQERERLEWQALLASVLSGDVLKSEKTRIAVALNSM